MSFGSQTGQVVFGIQSVKGTAVAGTRAARLRSGGFGGDRTLMIPDPEIGGGRDVAAAYLGPVAYAGDLQFYPRAEMIALLMKAALGQSSSTNVAGTNEVQTVATTGTPTGGTFTITFRGQTTTPLAFNIAAAALQTALQALTSIGSGNVTVTGTTLPAALTCTFSGALVATNPPPFTANGALLTGGTTPTVVITTTTPGIPVIGTHVITPANSVPWLTIEERVGNSFESYKYTDGKVNTLKIEGEATGYVMGSAGLVAISQISGFSAQATPAWDTTPMMVGGSVVVKFNGTSLNARNFSFEVNNNLETDDFRLGSLVVGDITEKKRDFKLTTGYRPQDSTLWKAAMFGTTGLTAPQAGPAYTGAVQIVITTFETIGSVVAGTPFSITIDIPVCAVAPFKVSPSADDVISTDIEFTPIQPDSLVPIVTVTVVNDLATVG